MADNLQRGPLISSGVLMGAGLGGFVDGILLHQMLQTHNMLSGKILPDTLVNAKINMFWDGVFHAAVWVMTAIGLFMLFRVGQRRDVPWSGRTLLGSLLAGWGLFNVVEGIINHQILGLHHVLDYSDNKLPADLAFIAFGVALIVGGWSLIRAGRNDTAARGEVK